MKNILSIVIILAISFILNAYAILSTEDQMILQVNGMKFNPKKGQDIECLAIRCLSGTHDRRICTIITTPGIYCTTDNYLPGICRMDGACIRRHNPFNDICKFVDHCTIDTECTDHDLPDCFQQTCHNNKCVIQQLPAGTSCGNQGQVCDIDSTCLECTNTTNPCSERPELGECQYYTCESGICMINNYTNTQSCGEYGQVCDGFGSCSECSDTECCKNSGRGPIGECYEWSYVDGRCETSPSPADYPCNNGDGACDGDGNCNECIRDTDCDDKTPQLPDCLHYVCSLNKCVVENKLDDSTCFISDTLTGVCFNSSCVPCNYDIDCESSDNPCLTPICLNHGCSYNKLDDISCGTNKYCNNGVCIVSYPTCTRTACNTDLTDPMYDSQLSMNVTLPQFRYECFEVKCQFKTDHHVCNAIVKMGSLCSGVLYNWTVCNGNGQCNEPYPDCENCPKVLPSGMTIESYSAALRRARSFVAEPTFTSTNAASIAINGMGFIMAKDLYLATINHTSRKFTNPLIVDVRSTADYNIGHVLGAISMPYRITATSGLFTNFLQLNLINQAHVEGREIIIMCISGKQAAAVTTHLHAMGYTRVLYVTFGSWAWRNYSRMQVSDSAVNVKMAGGGYPLYNSAGIQLDSFNPATGVNWTTIGLCGGPCPTCPTCPTCATCEVCQTCQTCPTCPTCTTDGGGLTDGDGVDGGGEIDGGGGTDGTINAGDPIGEDINASQYEGGGVPVPVPASTSEEQLPPPPPLE